MPRPCSPKTHGSRPRAGRRTCRDRLCGLRTAPNIWASATRPKASRGPAPHCPARSCDWGGATPKEEITVNQGSMAPADWQTLQFAPLWVFTLAAHADGKRDKKETAAFAKEISEAHLYKCALTREVLLSIAHDFKNVWACLLYTSPSPRD